MKKLHIDKKRHTFYNDKEGNYINNNVIAFFFSVRCGQFPSKLAAFFYTLVVLNGNVDFVCFDWSGRSTA